MFSDFSSRVSFAFLNTVSYLSDFALPKLFFHKTEFNAEGVSKISGALDENSDTLVAEFKEVVDLGKGYTSFAGKSDDYDGSVLFIYKMDGIE